MLIKASDPEFEAKFQRAIEILGATEMWKSNYLPPITRLLRRMGFKVLPPHFYSFLYIAIFAGIYFTMAWGLFMWLFFWSGEGLPWGNIASKAILGGFLFGIGMAAYYAYGRKRYKLPAWNNLLDKV